MTDAHIIARNQFSVKLKSALFYGILYKSKMPKEYHIITYGCQMNKSDSERIAALLEKQGYSPAPDEKRADLVVINMCSVRQKAVDKVYNKISNLKSKILIAGCVLQKDKERFKELGVKFKKFNFKKIKPETGFVPIMRGCDNFCSYCVVPYTRGREKYRPKKDIICEVKHLIKKGVKEITFLGQNVNSYPSFVNLLQDITALPGNFKISFITNHPKDFSDKLIDEVANNSKIKKYIHLPIQSGDNEILRKMNRKYTREDYLKLVKKIRDRIPNAEFTTDVIVGFPGETQQAFENTVDLFKQVKFSNAFIGKYSPRPGTSAYNLEDDVPVEEKKRREAALRALLR